MDKSHITSTTPIRQRVARKLRGSSAELHVSFNNWLKTKQIPNVGSLIRQS